MYSFSASSESRMRVSLTLVMPLTATVVAGPLSETTSAAALVSGAAVTGVDIAAVVATGSMLAAGVPTTGASFFATVAGSGLLGRMLLVGIPADGFVLEVFAAVSILGSGLGLNVTGCAVVWITGSDFPVSGAGGWATGVLAAEFAGAGLSEKVITTVPLVTSGAALGLAGAGVATATAGVVTAGCGAGAAGIGFAAGCGPRKIIDAAEAAS